MSSCFLLAIVLASSQSSFQEPKNGKVLEVGVASRKVTPRVGPDDPRVYLAGFGRGRDAQGIFGDIEVRALVLAQGEKRIALCAIDSIGIFIDQVEAVRKELQRRRGQDTPPMDIIVAATHTHAGPDMMGLWGPWILSSGRADGYLGRVRSKIIEAILEAEETIQPASIRVSTAEVLDRIRDSRPPEVVDPELTVMAFETLDGEPIGIMVNASVHPEVLWSDNPILSADFPYFLRRDIEARFGGLALYTSGSIGGLMTPRRVPVMDPMRKELAPRGSLRQCELYGQELSKRSLDALEDAMPLESVVLDYKRASIEVPLENWRFRLAENLGIVERDLEDGVVISEVSVLDFGEMQWICIPGELYPELWLGRAEHPDGGDIEGAPSLPGIKALCRGPISMVIGLANDELGYIIPPGQWDEESPYTYGRDDAPYGEVNSVGPQMAEKVVEGLRNLLSKAGR